MKYSKLIPVLLLGAMLTACNTTKKLYEAQEYDQVIQRLAPDICYGDMNAKRINMVAASYHKANQTDHERIQTLKASGQPDAWPEIYQRYCSMKGRHEALACFPNQVKKDMNYLPLNIDDDMMAARNKAESFLVAKANQLLSTGSKTDAQEAEKYVQQLYHTQPDNANLPPLQKKCLLRSADHILVTLENEDRRPLLPGFVETILTFDTDEIPSNVTCIPKAPKRNNDDAEMMIIVKHIQISPIRLDEVTFKETKDGKTVEVNDHTQNKTATITGVIKYYSSKMRCPVSSIPFEVTSTFKNDYTTIKGDREACSAETLSRLNSQPIPAPTDESMLLDAARKLNDLIANELK